MYKWMWNALGWLLLCVVLPILVLYGGVNSMGREVPDLKGLEETQAVRVMERAGFTHRFVYVHSDVPAGYVVSQDLRPGGKRLPKTCLEVTVSKGPRMVTVPNLVGATQSEAGMSLFRAGLEMAVEEVYDDIADTDRVISQSISPGSTVGAGSSVTVIVSMGTAPIYLPDLTGLAMEETESLLKSLGLQAAPQREYTEPDRDGKVISQSPLPGETARRGDTVAVTVGIGYGYTIVPDVKGMTRTQAEKALSDAGLVLSFMQAGVSAEHPGQAEAQSAEPGVIVKKGTAVSVVFFKNPEQAQVPKVTGMCRACAVRELENCGFGAEIVYVTACGSRCGKVISQQLPAGAWASSDTAVYLWVGYCCSEVLMPDVRGMTFEAASSVLAAYGLTAEQSADYAHDYAVGTVCRQRVEAGVPVTKGSVVTLYLNLLPNVSETVGLSGACGDPE